MTLSRKIKLKTTNSSAGPLKRFYEDSPLTDPEAQDPGLRITNYSGSYRVEYSLGNWSNNNELLRNVATDEQKTQWINAYANPGQAADYMSFLILMCHSGPILLTRKHLRSTVCQG